MIIKFSKKSFSKEWIKTATLKDAIDAHPGVDPKDVEAAFVEAGGIVKVKESKTVPPNGNIPPNSGETKQD